VSRRRTGNGDRYQTHWHALLVLLNAAHTAFRQTSITSCCFRQGADTFYQFGEDHDGVARRVNHAAFVDVPDALMSTMAVTTNRARSCDQKRAQRRADCAAMPCVHVIAVPPLNDSAFTETGNPVRKAASLSRISTVACQFRHSPGSPDHVRVSTTTFNKRHGRSAFCTSHHHEIRETAIKLSRDQSAR
jgi:hypothetical protein